MIPIVTVSPVLARTPKGTLARIVIHIDAGTASLSVEGSRALRAQLERCEAEAQAAQGMTEAEQDLLASAAGGRA